MKDESDELNPYAQPKADTEGRRSRRARGRRRRARSDLRAALERLTEHLADPGEVERDRIAAGRRIRVLTLISAALFVLSVALVVVGWSQVNGPMLPVGVGLGIISGVLGAVSLALDLSLVERGRPSSPEAALKSFLKSIPMGRYGYAWAGLCPTAREQTVSAPSLEPVVTGAGDFSMEQESGMKAYAATFARPGQGQMRTMAVKRVTPSSVDGDVAEVSAVLTFQSWPQWVSIVMGVSFFVFRPLVLVGVVLYFVTRKRTVTTVTKTMLRGQNGAWYVYDADLLEGTEGSS